MRNRLISHDAFVHQNGKDEIKVHIFKYELNTLALAYKIYQ